MSRRSLRRRATRATSIARLRRWVLAATVRDMSVRLAEEPPDRRLELPGRDRAFELSPDPPATVDDERPGLCAEAPLPHPAVVAPGRAVVRVDLDVDEADTAPLESSPNVVDDVDDRSAGAARAVARGRKNHDERLSRGER